MDTNTEKYVQDLFTSSKSSEESIMFQKGLEDISKNFISNEEFKNLLLNPRILNKEKLDALKEFFPQYLGNKTFSKFLFEIIEKGRISLIEEISKKYSEMNELIDSDELDIKIIVADKLDDNLIKEIVEKYKDLYKVNKINYSIEIDESIIGGIKVIVGNVVYDGTIMSRLKQMF